MSHTRSNRYIDKLQDLIDSYNATYNTSIKMPPKDVTKNDEVRIWRVLYGDMKLSQKKPKFAVDDRVKIRINDMVFRSFDVQYTEEDFW